jgi:uncharacterized protein DUF4242
LACGRTGLSVRAMRDFVGEQYLPVSGDELARGWAAAAREAAEQLTHEGTPVDYVRSIFIPEDETCIHLYRAESIDAVRAAAARASLRLDRLAPALSDDGATKRSRVRDEIRRSRRCG